MRILPKIASIFLLFCASCGAQIYDFHAQFYDFVDENKFIFTDGENSITCKINGAEIINLNMKKECFIKKILINICKDTKKCCKNL